MVGIEVDSTAEGSATRWAPGIGITIRGEKVGSEKRGGKSARNGLVNAIVWNTLLELLLEVRQA